MTLDPATQRLIERLARQVATQGEQIKRLSRKPQLGNSSVEAGALRAGPQDGAHVLVADDGVHVFTTAPDGTGLSETITLGGPDGNAWQSTDSHGKVLGSMSTEGDIQGQTLGVFGVAQFSDGVWLQGEPVGGQSLGDGTGGPTVNGRDMLGPDAQGFITSHPGNVAGDLPWLEGVALGQLTRGTRLCPGSDGWTYNGTNGFWHYRAIGALSWRAVAGRTYFVQASFPAWQATDANTAAFGASVLKVSTDPTGRVGLDTNGRILPGARLYAPSGSWFSPYMGVEVRCPQDVPEGQASVLMYNYVYAGRTAEHANTTDAVQAFMAIYDLGRAVSDNLMVPRDEQIQGSDTAPPAPDPPDETAKSFTITRDANAFQTFRGDGSLAPSVYNGVAAQGYCPAAGQNGTLRSEIVFPSVVPDLSGATIDKVEVRLHFSHWWNNSGGTACIGTHGGLGTPNHWDDIASKNPDLMRRHFDEPDGHWVTYDAGNYDAWKSGKARGVLLTAPNRDSVYYGICDAAKVRITGRK